MTVAEYAAAVSDREDQPISRLPARVAALILLSALGALFTAAILEVQAGATAYIVGESHWSKAHQRAVQSLYRYVTHGDPGDLAQARAALAVPLGDREARLALEGPATDLAVVRKGFLQGGNAPEDLGRLIWMYRLFSKGPYFRESVRLWREAEMEILRLARLVDEVEMRINAGSLDAGSIRAYQQELMAIDARLGPAEIAFSRSLVEGSHFLRNAMLALSALAFAALTWYALRVMRRTLRHVRETESGFRVAFHQAAVGMMKVDRQGRLTQANEALAEILGSSLPALRQLRLEDLVHPDDLHLRTGGGIDWERMTEGGDRRFLRSDGRPLWVRWTASMIAGEGTREERIFILVEDVSQARELACEIAHQASHDDLTGLINRREIERRLGQALAGVRRSRGRHGLCFVDLDQFKLINDTCGHAAGDRFLRQFATLLASQLRGGDWVGRMGGDEFAIFLENTGLEDAEKAAQRLHALLAQSAFHWDGRKFGLNCSMGLAEMNATVADADWLLRAADTACYLAKEEGRNRIRCYRESDEAVARRQNELEWVAHTQLAIAENRLLLYAQRIQSLHGPIRLQYEVLVRMMDHDGRIHPPGLFLPAMERYGQAVCVDRYVIASAVEQIAAAPDHLHRLDLCHINVSAQSIAEPAFCRFVTALLDQHPAIAGRLCFEITETAVIGNLTDACGFIDAVRSRGCKIALDDFGSGLSSFGYLKSLAVDILKIDGAFIRDLGKDDVDLELVRSISQVGRALGKATIAEWVETDAAMEQLSQVGVDSVQGYAIHRPCPLPELIRASRRTPAESLA